MQDVSPESQENEETAAGNLDEAKKTVPETAAPSLPNETSPNQTSGPVQHVFSNVGDLQGDETNESSPKTAFAWEDHPAAEPVFGAPEQAQGPKEPAPEAEASPISTEARC